MSKTIEISPLSLIAACLDRPLKSDAHTYNPQYARGYMTSEIPEKAEKASTGGRMVYTDPVSGSRSEIPLEEVTVNQAKEMRSAIVWETVKRRQPKVYAAARKLAKAKEITPEMLEKSLKAAQLTEFARLPFKALPYNESKAVIDDYLDKALAAKGLQGKDAADAPFSALDYTKAAVLERKTQNAR